MLKKLLLVFLVAFGLNLAWEFAHSVLYESYQGGGITNFILFRAAVWDAGIIIVLVFSAYASKTNKTTFIVIGGLIVSVAIELWALQTGRWAYAISMPMIPFLNIGLTPTIQLALTGWLAQKLIFDGRSIIRTWNH